MTAVVDASVVLAWLQDEPGSDAAEAWLTDGVIGAANWSEVLQKVRQHGGQAGVVARLLSSFGLRVEEVSREDGERAADLWSAEQPFSLGDRLCLALAMRLGLAAATADAAWQSIAGGSQVIVVR